MFGKELLFPFFGTDITTASITISVGKDVSQNDASATATSICQIMHQTADVTVGPFLSPVSRREHLRAFTTTNHAFFSHYYLRRQIPGTAPGKDHSDRRPNPFLFGNQATSCLF